MIKWIFRLLPALIMLQTLFFKFTGAPESIYIFKTLGFEPLGRYGSGIAELLAAVMILIPRLTRLGSLLTCMIMLGAIASHVFVLGVNVQGDGGLLFALACITFICAILNLFLLDEKEYF